jgi:hypothetical protein
MLTTLTVMFSFAMPFPRKFAWLKSSGVGKVLNNFNWCDAEDLLVAVWVQGSGV